MYTLVYQYVHSSFLLTCPAGSFLWKEIRNILRNLNREQQAQSTYFSHAASLLKCFKTGTQAAEILLIYLSSQVSADCQQQLWAVVLSEAFTVSEGRTYVNSHVLGLMENTERARRGKDHGHPQKHTHTQLAGLTWMFLKKGALYAVLYKLQCLNQINLNYV